MTLGERNLTEETRNRDRETTRETDDRDREIGGGCEFAGRKKQAHTTATSTLEEVGAHSSASGGCVDIGKSRRPLVIGAQLPVKSCAYVTLMQAKMGFTEDCETFLQVLRGFYYDTSNDFNEIKLYRVPHEIDLAYWIIIIC
ncbi:hypothetical protein LXL04_022978 [Taraxacum kok-saghyz]